MKSFELLKHKFNLIRYIGSDLGTLYFIANLPSEKKKLIRHLDGNLTDELLPLYEDIYSELIDWVEKHQNIDRFVFIPPLLEVGKDYYIRRFYIYDIAIRDYMDMEDEDYVEPPALFHEMQSVVSEELKETTGKAGIIQRILRKSLLEPSGKTIYGYEINKFIIVEPKISLGDIEDWKNIGKE